MEIKYSVNAVQTFFSGRLHFSKIRYSVNTDSARLKRLDRGVKRLFRKENIWTDLL